MQLKPTEQAQPCPCGSGQPLAQCCAPLLWKGQAAPTAQALMRARYSAFCLHVDAYLRASWHPQTRPSSLAFDPAQRWLGLKIVACEAGGTGDATGQVEFVARYKIHGKAFRLHENSRFCRVDGHWVYVDGDIDPSGLP